MKKEKQFYDAAIYQAASALSWEQGMLAQQRQSELHLDLLQKTIEQTLKLSADKEDYEEFIALARAAVANPKSYQVASLMDELHDLTKRQE